MGKLSIVKLHKVSLEKLVRVHNFQNTSRGRPCARGSKIKLKMKNKMGKPLPDWRAVSVLLAEHIGVVLGVVGIEGHKLVAAHFQ